MQSNLWKTVKLHPAIHAQIKAEAARAGLPLSDLLETVLTDWLRRQGLPCPPVQYRRSTAHDLFQVGIANPPGDPVIPD